MSIIAGDLKILNPFNLKQFAPKISLSVILHVFINFYFILLFIRTLTDLKLKNIESTPNKWISSGSLRINGLRRNGFRIPSAISAIQHHILSLVNCCVVIFITKVSKNFMCSNTSKDFLPEKLHWIYVYFGFGNDTVVYILRRVSKESNTTRLHFIFLS